MKLQHKALDRLLARWPADLKAVLIFGQDAGMIGETADAIAGAIVDMPSDPFRVDDLAAAAILRDPAILLDAATALSLSGGSRLVRVRDATNGLLSAFENLAKTTYVEAVVVVQAGDLGARSPLRRFFEEKPGFGAMPCYRDEGPALAAFIRKALHALGVRVENDALEFLSTHLGADRRQTRSEIEKLALMVDHGGILSLDDAASSIGDSGLLAIDDIAYATADGDLLALDRALERAAANDETPVRILRTTLTHFQRLHQTAALLAAGDPADSAMKRLRPPVFWKRKTQFQAQLRTWPLTRLESCLDRLHEAESQCKSTGIPDRTLCAQILISISMRSQPRRRRA